MGQQSFGDDLEVLSAVVSGAACKVELRDGGERCAFLLVFDESRGVRVMVADELSRWLRVHGKLWALSEIRNLAERAMDGSLVRVPVSLKPKCMDGE